MRGRRQGLELHLKTENRFSAKASRTPHHPSAAHRAALRCAPQLPPRRKHVSGRKSGNPANLRDPRPSTHSSLSWQRRSRIGSQAKVSGGTIIANHRLRHTHTLLPSHTRATHAKGHTRRPGAHNWCFGDPAKEKKQPRNSSLSDRSRENSPRPQGIRRNPPVGAQVRRARASQARKRAAAAQPLTPPQDLPSYQSGSGSSGVLPLALLLPPPFARSRLSAPQVRSQRRNRSQARRTLATAAL